jgi:hypothetical protein
MNPSGLKEAIEACCNDLGISPPSIAVIEGDDLLNDLETLKSGGYLKRFSVEGEEEEMWEEGKPVMSCNAYLGAFPIANALKQGAQIVITGRCVDSAIVLGPLIHEFGWHSNDFELLSCGSLAGHLIECGCHTTGGNFTDWKVRKSLISIKFSRNRAPLDGTTLDFRLLNVFRMEVSWSRKHLIQEEW